MQVATNIFSDEPLAYGIAAFSEFAMDLGLYDLRMKLMNTLRYVVDNLPEHPAFPHFDSTQMITHQHMEENQGMIHQLKRDLIKEYVSSPYRMYKDLWDAVDFYEVENLIFVKGIVDAEIEYRTKFTELKRLIKLCECHCSR